MSINTEHLKDTRDNVSSDLKSVIKEADHLLDSAHEHHHPRYDKAREKLISALHTAKAEFPKISKKAAEKSRYAAHVTDEYVDNHPWKAVGIAAAIGLLVGVVIGRGR